MATSTEQDRPSATTPQHAVDAQAGRRASAGPRAALRREDALASLRRDNARLRRRVANLTAALAAADRANTALHRELAARGAEGRPPATRLPTGPSHPDYRAHIRRMLSDTASRNP